MFCGLRSRCWIRALSLPGRAPVPVEVIDPPGRLGEIIQQLIPGDARQSRRVRLAEAVVEGPVGQIHSDDQPVGLLPGPEGSEQVGMADLADELE